MNALSSNRESPTGVIRRCLVLLRRLQRGPASKAELIAAVRASEPLDDPYGNATERALDKRFQNDKGKLRDIFGLELRYRRAEQVYEIADIWEPLLDLPDDALRAIAFLQETFEPRTPYHDEVQEFLGLLTSYLSPARRGDLERQRTALAVSWGRRDQDEVAPQVEAALHKALTQRRWITFDYYSPAQEDGAPRHHRVQPWERYFDSIRGHDYLYGYCLQTTSDAYGTITQRCYMHYRLGRIQNVHVLPDKLPPTRPHAPRQPLVYRLDAPIARQGVSRQPGIYIQREEVQEDGSVIVHAETDNVWWAVRTLLHYGAACEIRGGSEARYKMRRIVRDLMALYEDEENHDR